MSDFFKTLVNDKLTVYFLCAAIIILAVIIEIMIRIMITKTKSYKKFETESKIKENIETENEEAEDEDKKYSNNMFIDNRSISITINNFDKNVIEENAFTSEELAEDDEIDGKEIVSYDDTPKLLIGRIFSFCKKSFTARLIQAKPISQEFYSELKNYLLSFKNVKSRISWNFDSFNFRRKKIVKFNIKGKTLVMYIALKPNKFIDTKYHFKNVKDTKKYRAVPMLVYIRSRRAVKYAKELINILMSKYEIQQKEIWQVDYRLPYESKEELIKKGLIKPPYNKNKAE